MQALEKSTSAPTAKRMAPYLIFAILSFLSITRAEDRGHGLDKESPIALSPEAYSFFHPNTLQPPSTNNEPCDSPDCSSLLPLAATMQSTPAHESTSTGGRGLGAGGIAGIPLGLVFAGIVGVGLYVVLKRQSNFKRARPEQQQAEV